MDVGGRLVALLDTPEAGALIIDALNDLLTRPEGWFLLMLNQPADQLLPMVKPFLVATAPHLAPLVSKLVEPSSLMPPEKLRDEIDTLLAERLEDLTPEIVKRLVHDVISKHLAWLVVWGAVVGSLIGMLAVLLGFAPPFVS